MTLIAVYISEGCIGRCNVKCYAATEPACECICGGANHGAGLAVAIDNTWMYAEAMLEKYAGAHDLQEYRGEIGEAVQQLGLFEGD
jgi:hypothetical protein